MKIFFQLLVLLTGSCVLICVPQPGCELPDVLQGSWAMTRFGLYKIDFNTTHVTQFPIDNSTCVPCSETYDFYCYSKTGTQYVFRSVEYAPVTGYVSKRWMYMCLDLKAVDSSTVVVHELTSIGMFGPNNRIKHEKISSSNVPESCNLKTSNSNHGLLVKLDSLDTYSETCPEDIIGKHVDQTSSCTLDMDVCTDNTTIAVSNVNSNCSAKPLFTDGSSVKCLHREVKGTTTYLTVYHKDNTIENTTQPFTCLALQKSSNGLMMSQNPLICLSDQTADSSTEVGQLVFNFSTELCPKPNATTTPSPTSGLEPGAIAGIVIALLLLLLVLPLIILVCWCLLRIRRKRKQRENDAEKESNASEADDTDSVDSGCPPVPAIHFMDDEDNNQRKTVDNKKRPRKRHRKIKRRRRIIGPNGEIIYEESDAGNDSDKNYSDDFEDDDEVEEVTIDQKSGKRRKLKRRVRKYIRQRIGPGGQMITEEVESEYYETDSDGSVESWEVEPISLEIERAEKQRKLNLEIFGHDPLFQTKSVMTRKQNERRFQLERMKTTKDILKSARKTKQKKHLPGQISDDSLSNEDRKTPFLEKYEYKISMDKRFEDEGFWDEVAIKKTAKDIFSLDKLDARIDGKDVKGSEKQTHMDERDEVSKEECFNDIDSSGESTQKGPPSSAMKSASDSSLVGKSAVFTGSDFGSLVGTTEHSTADLTSQQEKARIQSAIRRLLTERLFGTCRDGDIIWSMNETKKGSPAKMGKGTPKVIFVNEYNESRDPKKGVLSTHSSSPELSSSIGPQSPGLLPVSTSSPYPSTTQSTMSDGLDKDKRYVKRVPKSHMGWFKTDYSSGTDRRFDKNLDDEQKVFKLVPGPHHYAVANSLVTPRLPRVSRRDVNMDGQVTPVSQTSSSRYIDVLNMDEWRLRKLLEELYKDKKYMDGLLGTEDKPGQVKDLAHYGRDYLLQMADFWESKGMLSTRPHQTLPGAMTPKRAKTSLSLNARSNEADGEDSRPKLSRNKSMF